MAERDKTYQLANDIHRQATESLQKATQIAERTSLTELQKYRRIALLHEMTLRAILVDRRIKEGKL